MATGGPCSDVIKFGYVEFRSKHLKTFRKRWLVLYGGAWSAPRLVKYTDEKHATQNPDGRHSYYINDVISAERLSGKDFAVKVRLASEERDIIFCSDSDAGANDWVTCIQKAMSGGRDVFGANLFQATNASVAGDVTIKIADGIVTLIKDGVVFLQIPMTTIRKYQMDKDNVFWIETGRSSPIGEGFLYFRSELAQYTLTRLHEQASQGSTLRRASLPGQCPQTSQSYVAHDPRAGANDRRPSLPTNSGFQAFHDSRYNQSPNVLKDTGNLYERPVTLPKFNAVSNPPPLPRGRDHPPDAYSPFPRSRSQSQDEYPRGPIGPPLDRINESRELVMHSERGQSFQSTSGSGRSNDSFSGFQRSGSKLVAPSKIMAPSQTEGIPYMAMRTTVKREVKTADDIPYTDMKRSDDHMPPESRGDYLTPTHSRPDERFRSDNRNS